MPVLMALGSRSVVGGRIAGAHQIEEKKSVIKIVVSHIM